MRRPTPARALAAALITTMLGTASTTSTATASSATQPAARAAEVIVIDADTAPLGAALDGSWLDRETQTIHGQGRPVVVTPPLSGRIHRVRQVPSGWVVEVEMAVVHVRRNGTHHRLTRYADERDSQIDDTGTLLAYSTYNRSDDPTLVVVDIESGDLVMKRRFWDGVDVLDLAGDRLWVKIEAAVGPGWNLDAAVLDLTTQILTRLPAPLRYVDHVDLDAGLAFGSRRPTDTRSRYLPTGGLGWRPWSSPRTATALASPDGRLVVTYRPGRGDAATIQVRRLRTGAVVRAFRGDARPLLWEDDRHVVVVGNPGVRDRTTLLRVGVDGTTERITEFGDKQAPVVPIDSSVLARRD